MCFINNLKELDDKLGCGSKTNNRVSFFIQQLNDLFSELFQAIKQNNLVSFGHEFGMLAMNSHVAVDWD